MARVKDIRIHDFRHSCASLLIDSGANITLVANILDILKSTKH
jgi:integrase